MGERNAAGTAKSYGLCAIAILKALEYPSIRIGLARNELKNLKKTTLVSFFEVINDWGLGDYVDYKQIDGEIHFFNGSKVIFSELAYQPSDPDYTRLGGLLLTFGLIDEVGETDYTGYSIYKSRVGRWKNEEFNIKPMLISTCNPSRNWLYGYFYAPFTEGTLEEYKKFIPALPKDNPHLPESYLKNLETLPYEQKQRLLLGNWDYEDDDNSLVSWQEINSLYKEKPTEKDLETQQKYISADIAFTSDKAIVILWQGKNILEIYSLTPEDNREEFIQTLAKEHRIPHSNISYDSDGVGKYLKQYLRNAKSIVNNSKALFKENYANLKAQLGYKLAEEIRLGNVKILTNNFKTEVTEELTTLKRKPVDSREAPLQLISKDQQKKMIGRSPDVLDAMMYGMIFWLRKTGKFHFA